MYKLSRLPEPSLEFAFGQQMEDPRDGITLFGPLDRAKPYGIQAGVVGTKRGIELLGRWVETIQGPIHSDPADVGRPSFPGFETAFRACWGGRPTLQAEIDESDIDECVYLDDPYQRVYRTVDLYVSRISALLTSEDPSPNVWFVVVPDRIYHYCRPKSMVETALRRPADQTISRDFAQQLENWGSLFPDDYKAAVPYQHEVNFHNQLKARTLGSTAPIQVIRESSLAAGADITGKTSAEEGRDLPAAIAWNLSTACFYKAGGRPWKAASVRDGVCYIGLVFKTRPQSPRANSACCAAQMFMDSGDGMVFRGALGPWYDSARREFHLDREAARQLAAQVVETYSSEHNGCPPLQVVLHGKVAFNDDEWDGFQAAMPSGTKAVGVAIRAGDLKVYRPSRYPLLRGMAFVMDKRFAYLWTKGYIPRLQRYPGFEVPNPLTVRVTHGDADLPMVLHDIMVLTKLNYNNCTHSSGYPVTLDFAEAVGEIITAAPVKADGAPPKQFKFYI
jgi:hypothetical protein